MGSVQKVGHCLSIALLTFFLLTLNQAHSADVNFTGGWLCNGNIAITYVDADDDYSTGVWVGSTWYPNETQVALYHIQGDIELSGDVFFSFIGTNCGETGWQTQRGRFVIRFIDALAAGWVWNNPSTWQEKEINRAEFRWSHDWCSNFIVYYGPSDPRNVWNNNPYFKATAYKHWSAGGAVVDSTTSAGSQILEGSTGFSEIYFATDFCENLLRDLKVFAGSGGGCPYPVGHNDYCRDCGPCASGEGDCDSDSECQGALTCPQVSGTDTCQASGCPHPVGHNDYCRDCGPCASGQGDCDNNSECQGALTCPQVSGTDTCQASGCPHPVGHNDYCRDCGPCASGQGDCDNNSECQGTLTCPQVSGTDTCQASGCPHPVGHNDYCRDCGPCASGQGDCDNNSECQGALTCPQVSGTDTCQSSGCPHPVGHLDYCRDCGPCAAGQGDCDSDSECQSGLTCAQVPGTDTCQSSGCPHPVGHLDYCRDCGPCAAGQGDCDNNSECQGALTCPQVSGTDTCQ